MDERPQCDIGNHKNPRKEHRRNLFDLGRSNFLLDTSLEARQISKNELLGYHQDLKQKTKTKNFGTVKETINKTKMQPTEWEKIFSNDISDKGLVSKIYKDL